MLCFTALLVIESVIEWMKLERMTDASQRFSFYKELLFLLFGACVIFFSLSFYKKSNLNTVMNYQKLFNGSPLPMYVMSLNNLGILAVNDAMVNLYGFTQDEFLTMTALDIRPNEEHDRIKAFVSAYDGSSDKSGKWLHQKKGGECFHVQINFHTVPLVKEEALLVMITDLSKSINDEKRISDLLHLYETVNKATADVIWDCDLIAGELTWMQGYYETYGYTDEFISKKFWEMTKVHSEDREFVIGSLRNVLTDRNKEWTADYRYICADGSIKYIRDKGYIIFNQSGEPVRMIGAMQDMDEQKKHEQHLLSHNAQLKEIAWINSHQVRRPLSNIIGLINLIRDSVDQNDEILQFIDLLAVSSKELDDAVILINRQIMDGKNTD